MERHTFDPSLVVMDAAAEGGDRLEAESRGQEKQRSSEAATEAATVERGKLIKEVFVCGASSAELMHYLNAPQSLSSAVLEPYVLYSSCNNSGLSAQVLPKLCFPSGKRPQPSSLLRLILPHAVL